MKMYGMKPKRPRDVNQLAKFIVDVATGQIPSPDPFNGKDPDRVLNGEMGGLKGGPERARRLTPEQRKSIAQKGATARWKAKSSPEI